MASWSRVRREWDAVRERLVVSGEADGFRRRRLRHWVTAVPIRLVAG
jgi:hypothetical protein